MPHPRRGLPLLCVLLLAGCGFGDGGRTDPGPIITSTDLALMVLPREQLGPLGKGFRPDDDAGPTSNRETANDTFDPNDSARTLAGLGRIGGYKLYYTTARPRAKRQGLVAVGTEVELLRDSVYATHYLNRQVDEILRVEGRVKEGVKLSRVSSFDLPGIGDGGDGLRLTMRAGEARMHGTIAAFRSGAVVGAATIVRADKVDMRAEVMRLAAALEERIRKVSAERTDQLRPAISVRKRVDPRPLTLGARDFPTLSLTGSREGYKSAGGQRVFLREFDVRDGTLGGSRPFYLRTVAQVFPSERAARVDQGYFESPEGRRSIMRRFLRALFRGTRVELRGLETRPLVAKSSDTAAFSALFDAPNGWLECVMVSVRSGRMRGSVTVIGRADKIEPVDLVPFGAPLRERLRTGS